MAFVYCDGTSFHDLTVVATLAGTASGNINMDNFLFDRPAIKRYKEVLFLTTVLQVALLVLITIMATARNSHLTLILLCLWLTFLVLGLMPVA